MHFLLSLLVLFSTYLNQYHCVTIGDEEHNILQEIIREFENSPTDPRYDHIIQVPISSAHLIPKVFIWCPMKHFQIPLRCPVDNYPLRFRGYTKSLRLHKSKERAPRMVYDIGGNILLVQSYYVCTLEDQEKTHGYLSAASEIMDKLPSNTARRLPLFLHYKSGFSNDLLDFLLVSLSQGHTFQEISEMISSLNYRKFVERNSLAGVVEVQRDFHDNILYSSSSSDKLMHVFLWDFEQKSKAYETHLNNIPCTTLVCDSSFKLERKCKVKGPSSSLSKNMHLENIFLGLNENGEVVMWKPTDSASYEGIRDTLVAFRDRLKASGQELNTILVPNCCDTRVMLQQIFPEVQVKMGIAHAVKSVLETLPKDHPDTQVFCCKLYQIFTSSTDSGEERMEESTSPLEIEANLDNLLTNWRSRLLEPTMVAIDRLRRHIRRGCLSGIPPGEGTEKFDNLHRHIQKSFLSRVTVITPEMAFAVFTCLIYAWNCKKQIKSHYKGRKAIPLVPIEAHQSRSSKPNPDKADPIKLNIKALGDQSVEPLIIECTQMNDSTSVTSMLVITADVVEYMFTRLLHIQDLVHAFKIKCQKSFSVTDFPILSSTYGISFHQKLFTEPTEQDTNTQILRKNLSDYGLEIDGVVGDGNCLFRSVILQIRKLSQVSPELQQFLKSIGLERSIEEDTATLRKLFVAELQNNFAAYKDWIDLAKVNVEEDLEKFKESGFFSSDIGDLCVKVCTNLLQVPIIVVPSLPNVKFFPFLPTKFTSTTPIYVAYNHTGPGHYDGTKELTETIHPKTKCKCGRSFKYKSEDPSSRNFCGEDSKCPCAMANVPCIACQCFNCDNKPTANSGISCKCGFRRWVRKRTVHGALDVSCLNKERATCLCAKAGLPCNQNCICRNCGNGKPKMEESLVDHSQGDTPQKRARKGIKRRSWGTDFKSSTSDPEEKSSSEWSEQEVICLMVCREVLEACNVEQNVHNISQVYRYIAGSKNNKDLGLAIGTKEDSEIHAKLMYLQSLRPVSQLVAMTTVSETELTNTGSQVA